MGQIGRGACRRWWVPRIEWQAAHVPARDELLADEDRRIGGLHGGPGFVGEPSAGNSGLVRDEAHLMSACEAPQNSRTAPGIRRLERGEDDWVTRFGIRSRFRANSAAPRRSAAVLGGDAQVERLSAHGDVESWRSPPYRCCERIANSHHHCQPITSTVSECSAGPAPGSRRGFPVGTAITAMSRAGPASTPSRGACCRAHGLWSASPGLCRKRTTM